MIKKVYEHGNTNACKIKVAFNSKAVNEPVDIDTWRKRFDGWCVTMLENTIADAKKVAEDFGFELFVSETKYAVIKNGLLCLFVNGIANGFDSNFDANLHKAGFIVK